MTALAQPTDRRTKILAIAGLVLIGLLVLSGARPYDRATWLLEVIPVLIVLPLLAFTYRAFPLTTSDMFCALMGASAALLLLSRWHDRQLGRLARR